MIKLIINLPFVNTKLTEKQQTLQDYIIRILQHFATKLRNITNFVMLFQAVMIFVQACLDQNFTHKGKGLLVSQLSTG
jgi:hypothetical protein